MQETYTASNLIEMHQRAAQDLQSWNNADTPILQIAVSEGIVVLNKRATSSTDQR
jgi:hypothetical protein